MRQKKALKDAQGSLPPALTHCAFETNDPYAVLVALREGKKKQENEVHEVMDSLYKVVTNTKSSPSKAAICMRP